MFMHEKHFYTCFIIANVYVPSTVVNCGSLNDPENGKVTVKDTFLGSVANYSCDPGYALIGDAMRTCLGDGTWFGNQPTCTSKYFLSAVCLDDI